MKRILLLTILIVSAVGGYAQSFCRILKSMEVFRSMPNITILMKV